ncbi:MAG: hypothetical protein EAX91_10965 [Candidatus Lokiarchaeota archaeon]|nr:hypothetical protein [Candidatus Lokiarchaeota archaeon]
MTEFHLIFIEFIILLALFIFLFMFSIISAESMTVFISIILFFIFLIPFFQVISEINLVALNEGYDTNLVKSIISYSQLIVLLIGILLFVELIYISFFN